MWFAGGEDRPLMVFAGIWTNWTSVRKVREGEVKADLPATQRDRERFAGAMVIRPDQTIWKYEDTAHPYRIENVGN